MHFLTVAFALVSVASATPAIFDRTSCSTPDGSGTCVATSSCGGFSVAGYCPGAANIQCCISKTCSTPSGSGTCKNTGNGCSGGSFVAGYCPGDSSVECCVKSSSSGSGGSCPPAVNSATLSLIEKFEGWSATPCRLFAGNSLSERSANLLRDADPDGNPTIGWGHLCSESSCANIGYPIPLSKTDGEKLLQSDLKVRAE